MRLSRNQALFLWSCICAALMTAGGLMFFVSHLRFMNPPQCPGNETELPDGSKCIIGANIGLGMFWLFGIGLAVMAGLGLLATPVLAVIARTWSRSVGPPDPLPLEPLTQSVGRGGTPDWAGRYPQAPPEPRSSASVSNPLCLVSLLIGAAAIGSLLLCGLFSVPLGIVALITGIFSLTQLGELPSNERTMAAAGIATAVAALLGVTAFLIWG